MIERHGILLWVNRILNPILETEVRTSVGVTFKKTVLDTFPKIQQNLGNLVSPPVVGYVVGYGIEHWLHLSSGVIIAFTVCSFEGISIAFPIRSLNLSNC